MKRICPASEAEVIAEFLKCEYYQKEYQSDRRRYEAVVMSPDLGSDRENALRKALLFRRHRVTWNELPPDVSWFRIQLEPDDMERIRVFPRGHWPKLTTDSSFSIGDVAHNIRHRRFGIDNEDDVIIIHSIARRLRRQWDGSSVLLIGVDDEQPLTILEGNHRIIAAALNSLESICIFRAYVGFSPAMTNCFWYQTTRENMIRHLYRRLRQMRPGFLRELKQRLAS